MGERSNGPDNLTSAKFTFYDAIVADTTLTGLDYRVAWRLLQYFNQGRGCAWPSHALLAKRLGCAERSAERSVKRLVEGDWFSKQAGGGRGRANEYVPNWKKTPTGESGFRGEKANKSESEQETPTGESVNPDSRVRKPRPASHPTTTTTTTMKKTKGRVGEKSDSRAAASLTRSPDGGSLRSGASRACKKGPATIGEVLAPMLKDSGNGKDVKGKGSARKPNTASRGEHERTEDGVDRKGQGGISMTGNGQNVMLLGPTGVIEGGGGRQEAEEAVSEDGEDLEMAEALGIGVDEYREIKAAKIAAVANLGAFPVSLRVFDLDRRLGSVPAEAREGVRLLEYQMWAEEQSAGPPATTIAATATESAA